MSRNISSYAIKGNDMVEFYNENGTYVRSIQAKGVKDVRISPNGEFDIYRNGMREHYDNTMVKRRTYR